MPKAVYLAEAQHHNGSQMPLKYVDQRRMTAASLFGDSREPYQSSQHPDWLRGLAQRIRIHVPPFKDVTRAFMVLEWSKPIPDDADWTDLKDHELLEDTMILLQRLTMLERALDRATPWQQAMDFVRNTDCPANATSLGVSIWDGSTASYYGYFNP